MSFSMRLSPSSLDLLLISVCINGSCCGANKIGAVVMPCIFLLPM
ncbi:hypothetical protein M758_UG094300 [Ceratodon purpureus]|nr:hypothetical protein M758_UG094300 [Ceratodon purpureus]